MKKLVLMAVAFVAVSFASCGGNKAANAEATDTTTPATEEVVATNDSTVAANDSVANDSAAVAE